MKNLDKKELKQAAGVLRAITHPLRMTIMKFIADNQPVNVTKIYKQLKLEQSVTSSHLSILRDAGFLISKRDGKKIFYSIDSKKIDSVLKSIGKNLGLK
ncbi:MAG: helix-turn-helix transcriptional regulator [Bacteroidetes bacterium]|nr:helix-turn-helix transcriptional regulator [Bacteroidota bacterium]